LTVAETIKDKKNTKPMPHKQIQNF